MSDKVNHPEHYTFGRIEVIDYIKDKLTPNEFTGYCIGNVLKYCSRWRHKGGVEDLKKAKVYLGWAIESEEIARVDDKDAADAFRHALDKAFTSSPDLICDKCSKSMNKGYAVQIDGKIKKICADCYKRLGR